MYSIGASSRSPSPITIVPSISTESIVLRMASTATSSAWCRSPYPIVRAAAIAAFSTTRKKSRLSCSSIGRISVFPGKSHVPALPGARHHKPQRSFPSTIYVSSAIPLARISSRFFLAAALGYNAARRIHVQIPQAFPDPVFARSPRRSRRFEQRRARPRKRTRPGTHATSARSAACFRHCPAVGPEVSPATFAEAEKLVQINLSTADRALAAETWRVNLASVYERRTGPRTINLEPALVPFSRCHSVLPGQPSGPLRDQFIRGNTDPGPLPANDADIAFSPVTQLSRWIEQRKLTSERLTQIYLRRIEQFDPKLRCIITLTRDLALAQAKKADQEIAAGKYRGPLHGIPWGGKDLLDTAGIPTTYGAEPYRNRIPKEDAAVVKRLHAAGAVLIAKLSLGALALNDIWFGGQTMNPWLLEEGSSGSSAGPGSATAAGLVGFAIGSETGGSIISPSMRCGITGLRPTYGRVPRTGA